MTIYARYIPVHVFRILKYQMKNNNENKILNELNLEFWYSMIVQAQDYPCDCSPLQQYYCFKNRAKPQSIIHCGCSRLDQYCCSKSERFCSSYLYASSEPTYTIHNKRCVLIKNSSINIHIQGRFFSDTIKESEKKTIKEIRFAKQACIMCVLEAIYDNAIELKSLYYEIKDLKRKRKRTEEENLELESKLNLIQEKHNLILKKKLNLFLILKSFKNDAQRATTYNFRGVILELIESAYDNTYNLYMVDDLCKYKIYVDTSEGVIRKFKPKKPEDINIIEDINTTEIIEESKEEKQNHDNRWKALNKCLEFNKKLNQFNKDSCVLDVLRLVQEYNIANNASELKLEDAKLFNNFFKFAREILNQVKEEDRNQEFKNLNLLDFILILKKLAFIKIRKELENELDEIIDIKKIKGKLVGDVIKVKEKIKKMVKQHSDYVINVAANRKEEEEISEEEISEEEISEEEINEEVKKKKKIKFHFFFLRKARESDNTIIYQHHAGLYIVKVRVRKFIRKNSLRRRRFSNFKFIKNLPNFVRGKYKKKLKKSNKEKKKSIYNFYKNSNLILRTKLLKEIDKNILNKSKYEFKKYFNIFKIFLWIKKQKNFIESKIFLKFLEKKILKKIIFKLILNLKMFFENILKASKLEYRFMRKSHTVISRFSFRIFHHKKFKYVNKKTKKNRKEYKLIQNSEYKFKHII